LGKKDLGKFVAGAKAGKSPPDPPFPKVENW
jgi:hypothetical protein